MYRRNLATASHFHGRNSGPPRVTGRRARGRPIVPAMVMAQVASLRAPKSSKGISGGRRPARGPPYEYAPSSLPLPLDAAGRAVRALSQQSSPMSDVHIPGAQQANAASQGHPVPSRVSCHSPLATSRALLPTSVPRSRLDSRLRCTTGHRRIRTATPAPSQANTGAAAGPRWSVIRAATACARPRSLPGRSTPRSASTPRATSASPARPRFRIRRWTPIS